MPAGGWSQPKAATTTVRMVAAIALLNMACTSDSMKGELPVFMVIVSGQRHLARRRASEGETSSIIL